MGKSNKKSSSTSKKETQTDSEQQHKKKTLSQNGGEKRIPQQQQMQNTAQTKSQQKKVTQPQHSMKKRLSPPRNVNPSGSRGWTFWLVVLVFSVGVGLTGVFFAAEVQQTTDQVYQQYVLPQLITIQQMMQGDADTQGSNSNIPSTPPQHSSDSSHDEAVRQKREAEERRILEEDERKAAVKKVEEKKREENRKKEEERRKEAERKAADKKKEQETKRIAGEKRKADEKTKEEERKKEDRRKEYERKAAEKKAEEERNAKRIAEEKRIEEQRKKEDERKKVEERKAVEKRLAEEREAKRIAEEEEKKAAEEREARKKVEEKRKEEEKNDEEERKAVNKKLEEERKAEDKRKEDARKAERVRKEERKREEENKKNKEEDMKRTDERMKEQERIKEEKIIAAEKRSGEKETMRKEQEKKREEEIRKEKDNRAAQKKVEEEREAKSKVDQMKTAENADARAAYPISSLTSDVDFPLRADLDEADNLLENDDIEAAIDKYDAILRRRSDSPRAHYGKALTLDKMGFKYNSNEYLEQSIEFLNQVMALNIVPDDLFKLAGRKLADRLQFRGWGGKSMQTFKLLTQKFPDDIELLKEYGVSFMMIGKNEKARDVFQKVLDRDSTSGFAKVHLGFILKTTDNNLEEAVKFLQAGIETGENGTVDGRFYLHLGDSLLRLDREPEARKIFQAGEEKGLFLSAWQRSLYNVADLIGQPWWSEEQTGYQDYLQLLKDNWETIRDEGLAQLNVKAGAFVPEEENLRDTGEWQQFTLFQQGRKNMANCEKAPKTCAIIDQIPASKGCKRGQVKFSVMSPGIHVWPHVGPTNCRLRAHLGLVVPEGPVIRVVDETRQWKEGQIIIFDDSFEHEVWHQGSELRMILIVDFWHPGLTEAQKKRLSAI